MRFATASPVLFRKTLKYDVRLVHLKTDTCEIKAKARSEIRRILDLVNERNGLEYVPPHIQYLIGGHGDNFSSGQLDIRKETQLILQSSHPVRYIMQRELEHSDHRMLTYHDWMVIVGRCLLSDTAPPLSYSQLDSIAKAVESGMFSTEVHQTVVDAPVKPTKSDCDKLMNANLGNKYATLVGDFFAVKAMLFAAQSKSNQAMLAVTRGVVEFSSLGFSIKLLDPQAWSWPTPLPKSTAKHWAAYYQKAAGYLNGGSYAALTFSPRRKTVSSALFQELVDNSALFLKVVNDLDELRTSFASPFVLASLPGILYQQLHPGAFDLYRKSPGENYTLVSQLKQIRAEILTSDVMAQATELKDNYARNLKSALAQIASSDFYLSMLTDLVDILSNATE